MLSKDPKTRPEVKDILDKYFPKPSSSVQQNMTTTLSLSSPLSIMKNTHHDATFRSKLLMLFLIRGISKGYQFRMGTKMPEVGDKFADVIFKFHVVTPEGRRWRCRYLKAKLVRKEEIAKRARITAAQLLGDNQGDLNLGKFFRSYCKIIKRADEDIEDLVVCTDTGFNNADLKKYGIELVALSSPEDILTFEKLPGKLPARYKVKLGYQLRQLMYQWSENISLVQKLRKYASNRRVLTLSTKELKNYHVALVVENVIDLKTNMFHQDFANGDNLSTGAAQLRQIVSEVATSNDWKNWKFKLAKNFGRQEIDVNYQPLPQTITEKEIDDFFDKLVFVVDTPNDTELDEILTSEVGQRYKTLDSDIQSDFILRKINWELRGGGRFLTTEDGQQILKEAGQQMYKVNLRAVSIDYQVTLRKVHNKDKREDVQAMAAQVRSYLECSSNESATTSLFQALRIVTTWPESTASKLFAALEIIPSYKYKDSYLVLPSKRLATQGEVTSVKMAFESGKFQLLDNDGHPLSAPIPALSATRN